MAKLDGWKRIGIIVSVVWILGAGIFTFNAVENSVIENASAQTLMCEEAHNRAGSAECDKRSTDYLANHNYDALIASALVAFIPVPLGWGFVYLILSLVAWVKRGFMRPSSWFRKGN
jgi:hypothetical protein